MSAEYNPSELISVPKGWNCKRLLDCTEDQAISYGIVQPGQYVDNGVPVIRVTNINDGQLQLDDVLRVSTEIESKYRRTRLKGGEVLLTLVGSTGQSKIVTDELIGWNVARAIAVIRPAEDIGSNWINICLQSMDTKHFLDVRANTTVQKTLNLKDVRDIPILLPPEGTRKAIEVIATTLAHKIQLNHQINQTLEQIAQAIFKSWFVDFEPVKAKIAALEAGGSEEDALLAAMQAISGRSLLDAGASTAGADAQLTRFHAEQPEQYAELRATAELFPAAMQDSELGEIPEGWKPAPLSDLFELHRGFDLPQKIREDGSYVVYAAGGLHGTHSQYKMEPPGIITGRSGVIGNVYLSLKKYWPLNTTLYVRQFRSCGPYYAYHLLKILDLKSLNSGSAVPSLNRNFVHSIAVLNPGSTVLNKFEILSSSLFEQIVKNIDQSELLSTLRDTLLPKLLSGELSVSDAEDQLAEAAETANV